MRVPDDSFITTTDLRPEISASWRRSLLSGLRPDVALDLSPAVDVDRRSRLLVAAAPVLDQMARELDGDAFGTLLANSRACIVDRRFGERRLQSSFDMAGIAVGSQFLEETTGTNSIATAFELRRGVSVLGAEHYMEGLKRFSCYGHPVLSRVTGRLEGVLDISCPAALASPLLGPFLRRAAHEVEQRLLQGARQAEQRMLAAYQTASAGGRRPVVVIGEGVVMASKAAMELLDPADHAVLHGLAADLPPHPRLRRRDLVLTSGRTASVALEAVSGTGGVLMKISPRDKPRSPVPRKPAPVPPEAQARADEGERCRMARRAVLISGEPGTGRTTAAVELAGDHPVARLDAVELSRLTAASWADRLERLASDHPGLVVVEDVQLLPPALVAQIGQLLRRRTAWIALTSAPVDLLTADHAALAAQCLTRIELAPLRARREELPALVNAVVRRLCPQGRPRFTPRTLEALAAQAWPGNLHELEAVLRHVLDHRTTGDVTPQDLPETHRRGTRLRTLGLMEQAEYDTIVAALRACADNKVHAARRLGMSRATLYRRLRALGIDDEAVAGPGTRTGPVSQIGTVTAR
ncbi:sigma-54-dependent Fis family transcriptional regulator [Streptomyces sp. NBC_01361]|uniref:sigma-54-dependent Fis family transcriptional regulator n=1 Tax=Streptomyces sp. NBC_01361 TaxID=2903838 RepID=UPI002E2FE98E|nr:helix-turn-helix domain-containing protein [Streptomyces sp. NBC_01361]